jgi:hypothetical protein
MREEIGSCEKLNLKKTFPEAIEDVTTEPKEEKKQRDW